MLHEDIAQRIIGCAFKVHNGFSGGCQEIIYQRALDIEMREAHLGFVREKEMDIIYKGQHIGTRRPDFIVEGLVMVEIKAVSKLEDAHMTQAINYLEVFGFEIGLLLNFGSPRLEIERAHPWLVMPSGK